MKHLTTVLLACFLLGVTVFCWSAIDTLEGEELTDAANIEGVTTTDTVEGQVLTAGGAPAATGMNQGSYHLAINQGAYQ